MTRNQFLNIVAFLILISGTEFMNKAPSYLVEKWDRYIKAPPPDGPAWEWGLDSGNQNLLNAYVLLWKMQLEELFPAKIEKEEM